jgi:hypothetical protein
MMCKKQPFFTKSDSSPPLGSIYEKDASAFTSSLFDFVATGLRTIQFLFTLKKGEKNGKSKIQ